jgi:thioredoxin reductase (NADPH)
MQIKDVAIVGAGPAGLAAAIAAKRLGLEHSVIEKGRLVNSIFNFPVNMVFFTTPELLEIGGLPLVTPYEKPTRLEALKYYRRVADTYGLQIEFGEEAFAIEQEEGPQREPIFAVETRSRRALRPFESLRVVPSLVEGRQAQVVPNESRGGVRRIRHSRNVVLAIGYHDHPNMLGVPGEDMPHVSHYYREGHGFYRQRVVIVGGGNSAAETALELYRAGAQVTLVVRRPELKGTIKYWVRPDIENRIGEGAIVALFETRVVEIHPTSISVERKGSIEELPADAVLLLTGYHPDCDLLRRAGVRLHPDSQTPEFDPLTFETNVPGLFLAGGAVCGKDTSGIFIENGRFHGETIAKVISERMSGHRSQVTGQMQ